MAHAPCKDCPDRVVGCHGTCTKYQTYRKQQDAENAAYRKQMEQTVVLSKGSWTGDSGLKRGKRR